MDYHSKPSESDKMRLKKAKKSNVAPGRNVKKIVFLYGVEFLLSLIKG